MRLRILFTLILLLATPFGLYGQTKYGRIQTGRITNKQTRFIAGATPDVSNGNIFKTNNGGTTTITNFLNGVDSQVITVNCGDANTTIQNNANIVTATSADITCTVNKAQDFTYDASQTKWIQKSGGNSGGSPAGNNGDLQQKNGAVFGPGGENDDGSTFSTTRVFKANKDAIHCGPNPWFDVRCFGSTGSGQTTTGRIKSGSPTLTVASAIDFANGQGIVINLAGSLPTITTPGTPIVTPNTVNGATTWNYKVIAEDYLGGLTAASAAGTTTTGAAGIGYSTVAVTGATRAAGVATYTTSSAHNLTPGMTVQIFGFPGQDIFNGTKVVQSTPTGTTFTTLDGNVRDNTEVVSAAVALLSCNTLTYPAASFSGSFTIRYWIYRSQGAGAFSLVGLVTGIDPYFVDCGANIAISKPSYVPATPPASPQAGYLSTTILSGGGTTTLTLATNAGTTAAAQSVLHNDGPALLAAAAAAAANFNGSTVYIPDPNPGAFSVNINGLVNFNSISANGNNVLNLLVAGDMAINQPLVLRTGMEIKGTGKRNTSFMYKGGSWVTGTSSPLIYIPFRSSIHLENLYLESNSGPYGSALYADGDAGGNGSNGVILDNVALDGFNGAGLARPAVFKGGFDYEFRDVACTTGNINGNTLPSPCIEFTNSSKATFNGSTQVPGRIIMERMFFNNSGISVNAGPNPGATPGDYNINGALSETMLQPFLSIRPGVESAGRFYLTDIITADQASGPGTPLIQTSGNRVNTVSISGGSLAANQPVLITDQTSPGLLVLKMHIATSNYGYGVNPHVAFNDNFSEISNQPFNFIGTGRALSPIIGVGAPSGCVVSAGGLVPVGPVTYVLTAIDGNGNESIAGPNAFVTTTGGNQTVTCTAPALPPGAIGFSIYRNTGGPSFARAGIAPCTDGVPQIRTGTFVDNALTPCGASLPNFNGAGSSILSSTGLTTFQNRTVSPTGFIATETAPSLTAARIQTIPDASGTYILDSTLASSVTTNASANIVNLLQPQISKVFDTFQLTAPRPGPTSIGSNWTANSTGGGGGILQLVGGGGAATSSNTSRASAFWNVGTFPNNQWAQATIATIGSNQHGPTVRSSGSTNPTYYTCIDGPGGEAIFKSVAGAFTSLASNAVAGANGDVVRITASGTNIACTVTSTAGITSSLFATDGAISSGAPGLTIGNGSATLTNFMAGGITLTGDLSLNGNQIAGVSGNSGRVAESSGALGSGNLAMFDASGNIVDSGIAASGITTALSAITKATTAHTRMTLGEASASGVVSAETSRADSHDQALLENLKKTGDQSVPKRAILTDTYTNATTRASNVNGLSFTVSASRNYTAVCHLYYQGSEHTAGLDVTITGPASPISVFYSYDEGARTTLTNSVASAFNTKLTGSSTIIAKTNLHATVTIGLRNGANAGTVQVQGSASGTGTVMVQAGSFCMVQ
jgi:hypothetical protein